MQPMDVVLVVLALVFVYFGFEGAKHGVIRRAVEVVGLIAAFLFASSLASSLQPSLAERFDISGRTAFVAAWAVVLVLAVVAVRLVAIGLSKLLRLSLVGWLDRVGGLALGLAFAAVLSSCLLIGLVASPVSADLKDQVREHPVTGPLLNVAPALFDQVRSAGEGERFLDRIRDTVEPVSDRAANTLKALIEDVDADDGGTRP